jgi:hypothetical protein
VRYDRGVLESFVDLTYRGLSLGRRIRLTQMRPSSGYLELSAPMPVGTQIAITTDDGAAFDAVVTQICEQVAGVDRAPGMTVAPALTTDPAAAWWTARVDLSDDDAARPRPRAATGRSRPVTILPRSHTDPPPLPGGRTDEVPTIIADLDARIAAAAEVDAAQTAAMPVIEMEADPPADGDPGEDGEHEVVDDGTRTTIMETIDPVALGLDLGPADDDDDDESDGEDGRGEPSTIPDGGAVEPSGRGRKKRKSR